MKTLSRTFLTVIIVLANCVAFGQTAGYPYGTYQNHGFDTVNVGTLNVHFSIPILHKAGRGLPFVYDLIHDNSTWTAKTVNGIDTWTPAPAFGWKGNTDSELETGYMSYSEITTSRVLPTRSGLYVVCTTQSYSNFVYHDTFGIDHAFIGVTMNTSNQPSACNPPASTAGFTSVATDGSGYTLNVTNYDHSAVTSASGANIVPPVGVGSTGSIVDSNGNELTTDGQGNFTDTTGNVVLKISGGAPSSELFTYQDTSGNSQQVTVNYTQYTVQTNFGCSGVAEYGPTPTSLVSSIVLPDGSSYQFRYEPTPGYSGSVTGRLASVTLPSGGTISYTYTGPNDGIACSTGEQAGFTRTIKDPSTGKDITWTYTQTHGSGTSTTAVVDPLNNTSIYDFVASGGATGNYYETRRTVYQGAASGTPLLDRETCYNGEAEPCNTTQFSLPITQIDTYSTLNGVEEDGSTAKYNSYGLKTELDNYGFGSSGRGPLLRKEVWTYPSTGIVNLVQSDEVWDGSGNVLSDANYLYDQTPVTASSGVPQHLSVSGPRGNLDEVERYSNSTTIWYASIYTYEDTGSVLTWTNGVDGRTTYSYDPTFEYITGETLPTGTSGVSLSRSATYDESYTGLPTSSTGLNGNTTQIKSYDDMLRPTQITDPDGGSTSYTYSPTQIDVQKTMSASQTADTKTTLDAYGRPSVVAVQKDASDWYDVSYCYDGDGRLSFKSYPALNSTGCSGNGDSYTYDALGRVTKITHADGTYQSFTYNGRATEWTNEARNVSRITQVDGLGRTTAICEVTSTTYTGSGSPVSCGLDIAGTGYLTSYAYSNNTTTITQGGQTRVFQTDEMGRTILIKEPESGTTTYSYAKDGTGLVVTRTKPSANHTGSATTTTTTQYDVLGRVISISYSDGTPTRTYSYDVASEWGDALTNPKGRLVEAWSANNSGTIFGYDKMGRVAWEGECTPSTCGSSQHNISYGYDLVGDLTSAGDGAGVTTKYTYSPAQQIQTITSSLNDATHPGTLVSNIVDGPNGPSSWQLGNGLSAVKAYDTDGRNSGGWLCNGSSQAGCTGGTQIYGYSVAWVGNELSASCDTALNQCSNYGYDNLGQLSSRTVTSGTAGNYSYVYDRWGNRWEQNVLSGSGPSPQLSFNTATNQVSSYSYDAAGNMTSNGLDSYTYDANGNVISVSGADNATYTYDALNRRVQVSPSGSDSLEFIYNLNGQRVSIWDGKTGSQIQGQVYWGTRPLEFYKNGTAHFQFQDWEGTERVQTSYNGAVEGTYNSLSYGDGYSASGTDADAYHYAMLDQDNSSDEHAIFREYSNLAGRWMSPDPYMGSYNLSDPQSMNRYAYARNNPLGYVDPMGLLNTKVSVPVIIDGCLYIQTTTDQNGDQSTTNTFVSCPTPTTNQPSPGTSSGGGGAGGGGSSAGTSSSTTSQSCNPATSHCPQPIQPPHACNGVRCHTEFFTPDPWTKDDTCGSLFAVGIIVTGGDALGAFPEGVALKATLGLTGASIPCL